MYLSFISVVVGGSAGCVLRWILGLRLNSLFPGMPLGTLLVNLVGGSSSAARWPSSCACPTSIRPGGC